MQQYLDLLSDTLTYGSNQKNRTGIDSRFLPGGTLRFDLRWGFPILTTKKVNFQAVAAELCGFLRGVTSAADFRRLGTKIWDANANENKAWLANPNRRGEDDLGKIYGYQWRKWGAHDSDDFLSPDYKGVDQLARVLTTLKNDPTSRRIIVSAWNPSELNEMALPPCHLLHQYLVEQSTHTLHMTMYQRSCDMFLGVPFNISSYALLLAMVARVTGYTPGVLTMFLADVHIYVNHFDQVKEQLSRNIKELPGLVIDTGTPPTDPDLQLAWLTNIEPGQIYLKGYDPHPPISAPMAV